MDKAIVLAKEEWLDRIENLKMAADVIARILLLIDGDGKGEEDAREFMSDIVCAITAMHYVAEFAADKCIFTELESTNVTFTKEDEL